MKHYSSKINLGQIKQFTSNESIIWEMNAGFFGKKTYTLKPKEDGTYDISIGVFNKDENKFIDVRIGQTFHVKNKEGEIVEGLTQTTLALMSTYDAELKKEVYDDTNALYITTHLLKEPKMISDKVSQIGWVDGSFGITKDEEGSDGVEKKELTIQYEESLLKSKENDDVISAITNALSKDEEAINKEIPF